MTKLCEDIDLNAVELNVELPLCVLDIDAEVSPFEEYPWTESQDVNGGEVSPWDIGAETDGGDAEPWNVVPTVNGGETGDYEPRLNITVLL